MATGAMSKGERTRAEIAGSAYRLFNENGYHGTSMRDIARGAGIVVGGIYNHFSSKEDIFQEVLREYHPYNQALPALQDAQGENLEELVRDAAKRMVGSLDKPIEFLNLMFIELVEFNGKHIPELLQYIFPYMLEFGNRFLNTPGELRPIPVPVLMRAFFGLFFSYVMTELILSRQRMVDLHANALDYFVDIYLHGILRKDATG